MSLRKLAFFSLCVIMSGVMSCSGSSTSTSSTTSTTSSSSNVLAAAFPDGMAVASPYAAGTSASASLSSIQAVYKGVTSEAPNPADMTYAEKQALIESIMNATSIADCFAYSVDIFDQATEATCYGPQLTLTGTHPDGAYTAPQQLPSGDIGIWEENEGSTGEACLAAKVNEEFVGVTGKIDFAMLTMATAFCVANNSDIDLPEAGASIDLSEEVLAAYDSEDSESAFDPSTVVLSRGTDTDAGDAVYSLAVTGNMVNNDASTNPVTLSMTHVPGDSENSTYNGLIQMTIITDDIPSTNCGSGDHTVAMSTLYEKVADDDLRVNFRQGVFCGEPAESVMFDANGLADKTNPKSAGCPDGSPSDTEGWGDDFNELIANVDPSTGYGNMVYAWQAGRCDGNTRVFQATLSATGGTDGEEGGCGYFGFGGAITDDVVPSIDGMICNWTAPGSEPFGAKTIQDKVQRQCVTKGASDTVFSSVADELAISYAPTISCDQATGLLCDGVACTTTNTLLDSADMSFTSPTLPETL